MIADVLARKGAEVATVRATTPLREVLHLLAVRGIGAVVVTGDDAWPAGIVSERDVVRALERSGAAVLDTVAGDLMTAPVQTCAPADAVDRVLATMTERRIRHMPVVSGDAMVGIVSIGDLVKSRIDELQSERDQLTAYISG